MRQLLEDYLKAVHVRPRTLEGYELNARRISPYLGGIRVRDLTSAHLRQCYSGLRSGEKSGHPLSTYSVRNCHNNLHAALSQAVNDGLISRNPADGVHPPKTERREPTTFTAEQLDTLWTATEDERLHPLRVLLGTSGMRVSEALGLKWGDLDWERPTLTIQRQVQRQKGEGMVFTPLKTNAAYRTIVLTDLALDILRTQRRTQIEAQLRAGARWENNDLMFSTSHGKPLERQNVYRAHKKALVRAELPHIRQHDFRHSVATLHLEQGDSPKLVQERLGHSTVNETLSTYSNVLPAMHRAATERLDSLFHFRPGNQAQNQKKDVKRMSDGDIGAALDAV